MFHLGCLGNNVNFTAAPGDSPLKSNCCKGSYQYFLFAKEAFFPRILVNIFMPGYFTINCVEFTNRLFSKLHSLLFFQNLAWALFSIYLGTLVWGAKQECLFGKKGYWKQYPTQTFIGISKYQFSFQQKQRTLDRHIIERYRKHYFNESWCYNIVPVWQSMKKLPSNNHLR